MVKSPQSPVDLICLIGQLGNGGTERQLYLFLKHLDRARIRPLVAVSDAPRGLWRERLDELGVPVEFLGGVPAPVKLLRFRRLVKTHRPRAVFSWSFFTNAFRVAAGRTWFVGSLRQQLDAERRQLTAWRVQAGLAVPKLVVNSSYLAEELRRAGVTKSKIEVVFNIFEPDETLPDRAALRRELGLPAEAVVVAGVGRDSPTKDWPFFLAAFAAARASCPSLHALLVGSGGPALQSAIQERGLATAFTVTGEVPEARRLLPAADLYFLSSRAEGLPNVLLEAIDAGCAIVTTDVGGVRDILGEESRACPAKPTERSKAASRGLALRLVLRSSESEAGSPQGEAGSRETTAGIIVNSGDNLGAAAALVRLAGDETLRRTLADHARARLAAFSPAAAMARYLEILRLASHR